MKKYFIIILLICLIIPSAVYAVWWNPFTWFNNKSNEAVNIEQKVLPDNSSIINTTTNTTNSPLVETKNIAQGTTNVFGVEMQKQCAVKFQDFIKNHGADYSKCLTTFDFNEQYCGGFDPNTQALSDVNIIVILDASGSMAERIGSEEKIDIAKKSIIDFLKGMPNGVNTGLIVYGHKGSSSAADKNLSCNGIAEVVKLGKNNNSNIINAMSSFYPEGWTPIAGSIDFAKNIFKIAGSNNKNYLVLVSDGIESCDGDALSAAGNIKLEIPNLKLDIIGFTDNKDTTDFLRRVSVQGGGTYLTASNSSGVSDALNKELLLIKKDCIYTTFFQMSSRYNANYFSNLNCWLTSYKKESDDFSANLSKKTKDAECNSEMSKAFQARENEFWYKKEALVESNSTTYKKIENDFNNQLKIINNN